MGLCRHIGHPDVRIGIDEKCFLGLIFTPATTLNPGRSAAAAARMGNGR
jgi:hypothetical protein